MSHIFLTGATGFIGSHLAQHLTNQGHQLTLLIRDSDKTIHPPLPQTAQCIIASLAEVDRYAEPLTHCEVVMHLAADYRIGLPNKAIERQRMYQTNVEGTLTLLDAAKQAGIQRFIYASTTAALGETHHTLADENHVHNGIFRCYYEETKHIAHRCLQQRQSQGAPIVMAILDGVFGIGDNSALTLTMQDFLRGKLPVLPDSQSRFQLCHVTAICQAFELLLTVTNPAPSYLFTGQDYSMQEIIGLLAQQSHKPEPKKVAVNTLKIPAYIMDFLSHFGAKLPLSKEVIHIMDGSTYTYASAKAQQTLGWSAGDTQQALIDYMQYLIAHTPAQGSK